MAERPHQRWPRSAPVIPNPATSFQSDDPSVAVPATRRVEQILFTTDRRDTRPVIMSFDDSSGSRAILTTSDTPDALDTAAVAAILAGEALPEAGRRPPEEPHYEHHLTLLLMPEIDPDATQIPSSALQWAATNGRPGRENLVLIAIHGATIAWAPGRAVLMAHPSRIESVRLALLDFCFYEAELRSIEDAVSLGWPNLKRDAPLAFEFDDRSVGRRSELSTRFQRVVALRCRASQIMPHLNRPAIHPPTLASQIGERFRERSRLESRGDFVSDQLEIQERVYEQCGQRASDYMIARKENLLCWMVVVLLGAELVLLLVDLLASTGV